MVRYLLSQAPHSSGGVNVTIFNIGLDFSRREDLFGKESLDEMSGTMVLFCLKISDRWKNRRTCEQTNCAVNLDVKEYINLTDFERFSEMAIRPSVDIGTD